ncbi:TonB-dependent receptor [Aurantibacter crassamenti]|uniref:SusC/RagA family TonB-linked outer membrane protein n=1 Tax=Aurantibacter crassamenti TaxID=1837375 RepID=UPI001939AB68|nr:TonB-dependent receptor [Aurantibacter crassamenti]MBM1105831.1 TonB-dependent receptor [Aurantibacter crassamenti]
MKTRIKFYLLLFGVLLSTSFYGQSESTINGVVSDGTGVPLPGVTVIIKNSSTGAATDFDGKYSIKASSDDVLVFSYIGFKTQEIAVNNQSNIDVAMIEDASELSEVIVVGYGTQKKSDLTGSVASISADELNSQPITSMEQGMQGKIAGVNITNNSSAPGGGISVKIRGTTSILNGNEPLYVIDGFPVTGQSQFSTSAGRGQDSSTGTDYTVNQNPLSSLNPSDIQSIEVLKDASAAAIYGVRGANGVILITTKRGQTGAPRISYNGYGGIQTVSNKMDMLNAQEYQDIYNMTAANSNDPVVFAGAPAYDTDWQDEIFRSALIQNHQLSVNGGSESVQYNLSGSMFEQEGIIKGSDFTRYSLRANLDIKASEKFKIGTSLNISRSINNAAETEGEATNSITALALSTSPILPIFQPDGTYSSNRFVENAPDAQGSLNPVAFINEFSDESVNTRILGTLFGEYELVDDLKFKVSVGTDIENRDRHVYRTSKFNNENPLNSADVSSVNRSSLLNENTLNYNKTFGNHNLQLLGGFTMQKETEEFRLISSKGFATDITGPYDLGGGSVVPNVDSRYAEFSIMSFLGRINYNFDDRYLITVTGRRDGSSKFAENNKWAFFPSAAVAWRVSNEDFMAESDFFDNLKFRAGWGQVGNQELPTYRSLALLQSAPYNFGDGSNVNGFSPLRVPVPDLTWEITSQANFGLDASVLKGRVNATFDYYIKKTEDLLLEVRLPETSGIIDPSVQNLGEMENVGWELSMDGTVIDTENFRWNLGFNMSGNKNEVTSLGDSSKVGDGDQSYEIAQPTFAGSTPRSYVAVGQPTGVFFGYKTDGLYRSQAEADAGQVLQDGVLPGMVRYVDVEQDNVLDSKDRTVLGSPHPDLIYGFNTSFTYKNLELRTFFQGQKGGLVYNAMRRFNTTITRGQNVLSERADYWTTQNTDAVWPTPYQNAPLVGGSGNIGESDFFLEDASYLRMREITLTYNFPENFLGDVGGSIYVTGQNLFTITDYLGYNPDTNGRANVRGSFGWDISSYPLAQTILMGLKLDF